MEVGSDFENLCEQYLLGALSESDRQQLEEAYFTDDELFERYLAVKEDLIDAYSRSELPAEKRRHFEQHFLSSTARQKRIDESRELIKAVTSRHNEVAKLASEKTPTNRGSFSSWLAAFRFQPMIWRIGFAALLLAVIVVGWIVVRQRDASRSPDESARQTPIPADTVVTTQSPQPSPNANIENITPESSPTPRSQPQLAVKPSPEPLSAQIASLVLIPVSSREPGISNSLVLGPDTKAVRLTLVFSGGDQNRFGVLVQTVDGQQVFSHGDLKATSKGQGRSVTVTFDSSLLKRQDYIATLNARTTDGKLETIGDYYFRVERSAPASSRTPPK